MPKSAKSCYAFIFCLILCLGCIGAAYAYDINEGGEYNVSEINVRSEVNIYTTEPVTLIGKLDGEINCKVEGVTLTLNNMRVTSSELCALAFVGEGNTLIVEGKNTLKSGGRDPGIRVEEGMELTIKGDGSLTVVAGSNGAGIGGGDCSAGGTITIESGEITATGVGNGAGIGGGSCRDGGTTTITGGTIVATGGEDGGAGIGGASENGGGTILITGGTITATGGGEDGRCGGCGIGEGWNSSSRRRFNGTITITGGTVTATGEWGSRGIGGGGFSSGGIITVEGGTITANGGIGGGIQGIDDGLITITGGTIVADGGIGPGSDIIISGGDITAIGSDGFAGIDAGLESGSRRDDRTIRITGGTIVAIGGRGAAGIGSGSFRNTETITITGGTVTATGGDPFVNKGTGWDNLRFGGGAGIGGGYCGFGSNIIITGGTVKATGGEEGAGLGTGASGGCGSVTISGGTVEAIGGACGAGIGGGLNSNSADTIITGSSLVYARRGEGDAYDIGAGEGGENMQLCLYIKEQAAVFLGTNKSAPPAAKGHTKKRPVNKTDPMVAAEYNGELTIFGIAGTGESPWTDAQGGWFVLRTLQYDANGGEGVLPDAAGPLHVTVPLTVAGAEGLTKDGYTFTCWNTRADLRGKTYFPGDEIHFLSSEPTLTLYAQWDKAD
ncbi:MAG TPA: InlB B-repeat-containing protein [Candidatus Limiplasma sp.]|nr:InlB B-repeat-containing protein [Candidatus Limiplasma sp.]